MKHILFVDDEPNVLDGLRRMLRPQRNEWHMSFALNGEEALLELSRTPVDVIVSDMRMPQMDGMTLLTKVRAEYPHIVRIVLSGFSEYETALRAVPVANQFLMKPCEADVLKDVIERSCRLKEILNNETLTSIVGGMENLPSIPKVYQALTRALTDMNKSLKDIGEIVKQDIGISTKILQLVNSAFFALRRSVTNIETAVSILGASTLKNLTLSCEVFESFESRKKIEGFSLEDQQDHALLVAKIAKNLFTDKEKADDAYTVGILHDVGKLIMATQMTEKFSEMNKISIETKRPMFEVEKEKLGVTHSEIGAYLLGLWGLPYPIVEAVAYHHSPVKTGSKIFDLTTAVHIADVLAHECRNSKNKSEETSAEQILEKKFHGKIDVEHLQLLGVDKKLETWKKMAREFYNEKNQ